MQNNAISRIFDILSVLHDHKRLNYRRQKKSEVLIFGNPTKRSERKSPLSTVQGQKACQCPKTLSSKIVTVNYFDFFC